MNVSAIIGALVQTGATPEMILAVVKVIEEEEEKCIKAKREKDADRQRRHRMSRDVTVTDCDKALHDVTLPSPLVPPSDGFPDPSLTSPLNPPTPSVRSTKISRGSRLEDIWELPDEWGDWAMKEWHLTFDQVVVEAEKFKNYWLARAGPGGVKLDWYATWRNWVIKNSESKNYEVQQKRFK